MSSPAGDELFYFLCIFFIIMVGFVMSFHMAFGGDVEEFRAWNYAFYSLFLMIMGDFDYYNMWRSNRFLAPIFMMLFLFLVFIVLVNMFVAIISASYASASDELLNSNDDFLSSSLKLFFRDLRMRYFGWVLGKNNKLHRVQRLLTAIAGAFPPVPMPELHTLVPTDRWIGIWIGWRAITSATIPPPRASRNVSRQIHCLRQARRGLLSTLWSHDARTCHCGPNHRFCLWGPKEGLRSKIP